MSLFYTFEAFLVLKTQTSSRIFAGFVRAFYLRSLENSDGSHKVILTCFELQSVCVRCGDFPRRESPSPLTENWRCFSQRQVWSSPAEENILFCSPMILEVSFSESVRIIIFVHGCEISARLTSANVNWVSICSGGSDVRKECKANRFIWHYHLKCSHSAVLCRVFFSVPY